jgi:transcriptional regulator with XRE-family HTH domain
MMDLGDIRIRLAGEFKAIRLKRGLSFDDVSSQIKEMGGHVSPKTVYNIENNASNYEFQAVYWVARAYDLSLGEVLYFTVERIDQRAHTLLGAVMRLGDQDRNFVLRVMEYILQGGDLSKNIDRRA